MGYFVVKENIIISIPAYVRGVFLYFDNDEDEKYAVIGVESTD
jgi:hypothetical protein